MLSTAAVVKSLEHNLGGQIIPSIVNCSQIPLLIAIRCQSQKAII